MISSLIVLALTGLWPLGTSAGGGMPPGTEPASPSRWTILYARLPLSFEANQGQADPTVKYLARGPGYTLWLTSDQAVLALKKKSEVRNQKSVLRMRLVGANPRARVTGLEELPGKSNYFIGNDPRKWRTNVPNYAKVKYANVYPGVDLVYHGHPPQGGQLEYDFVVQPGADPSRIVLDVGAVRESPRAHRDAPLRLDADGDLLLRVAAGALRLQSPVAYQPVGRERRTVAVHYVLRPGRQVGFTVGAYDRRKPLVIDPVLSYSTYLGGTGGDVANGIAVDTSGNAYVTGMTGSVDFPIVSAEQTTYAGDGDAFVVKLNAAGSGIIYSTYLGGNGPDVGNAIAVDSAGNAYVAGSTSSPAFPTVSAFQSTYGGGGDGFIAKLNAKGTALLYSSYLGGSSADFIQGVALDSSGAAYVTGSTESTDFPTVNPLQIANDGMADAFVAKVNPSGSALVYSTYLGGSGADVGNAIAVDSSSDSAYLAGTTLSTNFPTQNAFQSTSQGGGDAFVAELNPAGTSLVFSTYLGGSGQDRALGMALDSKGSVYVAGDTASTDFPTTANAFQSTNKGQGDAFVCKLSPGATSLVYSTLLGGAAADQATAIAVDSAGDAYVTGFTSSSDFPTVDPLQAVLGISGASACSSGICPDAFAAELNTSGTMVYSTYLGGKGSDFGNAIAVDSAGQAYVAGSTTSTNFPVIVGAFQGTLVGTGSNSNAFVAKINRSDAPGVAIAPQQLNFSNQALGTTSNPQTVTFINAGSAPLGITSIEAGTNFTETNDCGTSLPSAGGNCTIQVAFAPTTLGTTTDRITINDSAPGSPHHITVAGTGVASSVGSLTLSPTSLAFPAQTVGVTSPAQSVRLTNNGQASVTLATISATGDFLQTNNCGSLPSVLNVGTSCTISVTFKPTATGNRTGSLSISANVAGSPQAVSLAGTGNPVFTLSANTRSTVIVIGTTTATFTVNASAPSSFTSSINLSCASGASCTFNPTSIYAGQSSSLTVTGLSATTSNPLNLTVSGTSGNQTASVALTVFLADFSLSVTPLLATVSAGKSATYTITVTPSNGFNQVVQLGCTGLPQATTCTLSPPAVALTGTATASSTVTLTTTVQTSELHRWPFPDGEIHPRWPGFWPLPWALSLAALALLTAWVASGTAWMPIRRHARATVCVAALLFLTTLQASCNDYFINPVIPTVTGTPYGVFTITITGTLGNNHAVTHASTMNLSVGP